MSGGLRVRRGLAPLSVLGVAFIAMVACGNDSDGDSSSSTPCIAGESRACVAPGGCSGGQICKADGSGFELCQCGSGGTAGTGATGTGGSSGAHVGGAGGTAAGSSVCPVGLTGPALVEVSAPNGTKYCIDSTEVTYAHYDEFLAAGVPIAGQNEKCTNNPYEYENGGPAPYSCKDHSPNLPAGCVDHCDALAYCKWAGKRLCGRIGGGTLAHTEVGDPNLSQWLNACSVGGTQKYAYGDTEIEACNVTGFVTTVATLTQCQGPTDGLFDLSSNSVEWEDSCDAGACSVRTDAIGSESSSCASVKWAGTAFYPAVGFRCCHDGN